MKRSRLCNRFLKIIVEKIECYIHKEITVYLFQEKLKSGIMETLMKKVLDNKQVFEVAKPFWSPKNQSVKIK